MGDWGSRLAYLEVNSIGENKSGPKFLHDRVVLIGHRGYLGTHILQTLERSHRAHLTLDPRTDDLGVEILKKSDIVIDASRLKSFNHEALAADELATKKLRSLISNVGAKYLRIGSTLEITPGIPPTEYLAWSSGRTNTIHKKWKNIDAQIIFVPNIFGGTHSSSVVDLLKHNHRIGEKLQLADPNAFRDFLHMDFFLHAILQITEVVVQANRESITLTSGFQYRIGDLAKCLISNSSAHITGTLIRYRSTGQQLHYPDTVLSYLLDT